MYSAVDLSKYIVDKCTSDGKPISNLQLQKILYYIQREFLKNGSQAFQNSIEAWQFGPVVPNSYYNFCGFGSMPISINYENTISLCEKDAEIVNGIIEEKRDLDPWQLVNDTHKADGAWARIYDNGAGNHKEIPTSLIKEVG